MFDVFVFNLDEILCQILHELKGVLKVFERNHFHPEELHAHQKGDDGLGRVGRRLAAAQLPQLGKELSLDRGEPRLGQNAQHFGVQVRNDVNVGRIRAQICSATIIFI